MFDPTNRRGRCTSQQSNATRLLFILIATILLLTEWSPLRAQAPIDLKPVTDTMLLEPDPENWLMWRRTLNGWGFSPLDQIDRDNVSNLRMVWSRAMAPGSQQATPLVYEGVMFLPNPRDTTQAIDADTGDLLWEYRREVPEDIASYVGGMEDTNRNVAIYGNLIIDTSADDYLYALDARTGRVAW